MKEGYMWTRVRVAPRFALSTPRGTRRGHRALPAQWAGTTECEAKPELGLELPTPRGKLAHGFTVPTEPTPQEENYII